MKTLYVGNLPYGSTEEEIDSLFSAYGTVHSVKLVVDRETGRPRGFCFVEMADGVQEAVRVLDSSEFGGRKLRVNEAEPRKPKPGVARK